MAVSEFNILFEALSLNSRRVLGIYLILGRFFYCLSFVYFKAKLLNQSDMIFSNMMKHESYENFGLLFYNYSTSLQIFHKCREIIDCTRSSQKCKKT